jgi:hypothetical protein
MKEDMEEEGRGRTWSFFSDEENEAREADAES